MSTTTNSLFNSATQNPQKLQRSATAYSFLKPLFLQNFGDAGLLREKAINHFLSEHNDWFSALRRAKHYLRGLSILTGLSIESIIEDISNDLNSQIQ